jgi:hypothetical protein
MIEVKPPVPSIEINRVKLSKETIGCIANGLRNFINERLTESYFEALDVNQAYHEKQERRFAYNMLAALEYEPRYDIAFGLRANLYHKVPAIEINSIRLPDSHYNTLVNTIKEEIIQLKALIGLVDLEQLEKIADFDDNIGRLVDVLKKLGVDMEDEEAN